VAVLSRGEDAQVLPLGTKAFGEAAPMPRDALFRIASMTKAVTAAAVMMLVEDSKLKLDEPVDRLLPELANRRVLKALDGPLDATVPANRPNPFERRVHRAACEALPGARVRPCIARHAHHIVMVVWCLRCRKLPVHLQASNVQCCSKRTSPEIAIMPRLPHRNPDGWSE